MQTKRHYPVLKNLAVAPAVAAAVLITATFASPAAMAAVYDHTITINDSERPINVVSQGGTGINPYSFLFTNLPMPISGLVTITVSGEGDFDGIDDVAGYIPAFDGFIETLSVVGEGLNLVFETSTVNGPFGSRTFYLSATFGFNLDLFLDGQFQGGIYLGNGVDENFPSDFLSMRLQYDYDAVAVPLPGSLLLLGGAMGLLRRRTGIRN